MNERCPICSSRMSAFYKISAIPANSCILMKSEEEARRYPRGDIVLGFCDGCGFIGNMAFDQRLAEYSSRYEETQGYSTTFQHYHQALVDELVAHYDLHDKSVLEIGCGKGEFLALLCRTGRNRGVGFDPGYDPSRGVLDDSPNVEVITDFYSEKYADHQADFVCCKMTLEHIPQPAEFIKLSRRAMLTDVTSVLYVQVPESLRIVRDCAFEDIYYEHCCYFTAGSLTRLLRGQGLSPLRVYKSYGDQYLVIEAGLTEHCNSPPVVPDPVLDEIRPLIDSFPARNQAKIANWRQTLARHSEEGSVVLWGSGSKAVAFLGAVDSDGWVDRVVDVNPHRQGHFMPTSARPIIAPAALKESPPAAVIVMNPMYRKEVASNLLELGLEPALMTL